MRFRGKFIVEVDAPTQLLPRLSADLLAALRYASAQVPTVHSVDAQPHGEREVIVTFIMESGATDDLDDIVDDVFNRALRMLRDEDADEADELTVVESGLVPA